MKPAAFRPDVLTPELVLSRYEALLRSRIKSFRVADDMEDELFQDMFLGLIQVSKSKGTSFLERYDPCRAAASVYLQMYANQFLTKWLEKQERTVSAEVEITYSEGASVEERRNQISESVLLDTTTWNIVLENEVLRNELLRLVDRPPYNVPASYSADGEPRSTKRIVELLLTEDLSLREIGRRLSLSPNEVCRRVKTLRREPWVRRMAEELNIETAA